MEEIPLPEQRARNKRPIHIEFRPRSFPQRFSLQMDWNSHQQRWIIKIEHLQREFTVTKSPATPYRPYSYMPYCAFLYADPSAHATEVTPENLGDEMKFWVLPGPSGQQPEDQ